MAEARKPESPAAAGGASPPAPKAPPATVPLGKLPRGLRRLLEILPEREWMQIRAFRVESDEAYNKLHDAIHELRQALEDLFSLSALGAHRRESPTAGGKVPDDAGGAGAFPSRRPGGITGVCLMSAPREAPEEPRKESRRGKHRNPRSLANLIPNARGRSAGRPHSFRAESAREALV